jgi:hypothetical protein
VSFALSCSRESFLRLTQPGEGTEDTKRRASIKELLSLSGTSPGEENIVQKLADAPLLTTEGDLTQKDSFVEVAHEALIRNWPQLRMWIDADRAGLRTRTRLSESARDWKNSAHDPTYLYAGARLAVAEEWAVSHPGELSIEEGKFLHRSREAQQQRESNELEAAQRLARVEQARADEAEKHPRGVVLRSATKGPSHSNSREFSGRNIDSSSIGRTISASLFFGVFTRELTGHAFIRSAGKGTTISFPTPPDNQAS